MTRLSRRGLLTGAAGLGGALAVGGLAGCSTGSAGSPPVGRASVGPGGAAVAEAEAARHHTGRVVAARLTPAPARIDLGGRVVSTWAYDGRLPGPVVRARAGDTLRVRVDNRLPDETSVHWHGIALRNDMDGVPGVTQDPIPAGGSFTYDFTAPDPGTYFFHPHTGLQLDRGLSGMLVVDDPAEPGDYDAEWLVHLDDWVDGTGRTPDDVLAALRSRGGGSGSGGMGGMPGMGGRHHGGMGMGMGTGTGTGGMRGMSGMGMSEFSSPVLGGAGDVRYPLHLVNGRPPSDPDTFRARPGTRVRIRMVNAGSDTAFRVALGGHRMTVTHTDGFPVAPVETDALMVGMGERYDVVVTLADGVFPFVASAEGKPGRGFALVRTGGGTAPRADVVPTELGGRLVLGTDLSPAPGVTLRKRSVDRTHRLLLAGSMAPYRWTINGRTDPDVPPLPVVQGERVRLQLANHSMMFHPMHLHGHTFALAGSGLRKDTVIVRPMQAVEVDLDADNPGQWMVHCHNAYHMAAGMMTTLSYRADA
ncbi:MAG: multicopper oxidase family protein [Nocardioidaceae bacterium]